MTEPYNPLDMANLGESITNALLAVEPIPMADLRPFAGAGLYAIYYTGSLYPYTQLGEANADGAFAMPIYVGKAEGRTRTGAAPARMQNLFKRLSEHKRSIEQAENLDIADFYCRWLVTEQIWIPLGESILIGRFAPVWNAILDGFGNHVPGLGRASGYLSRWDTLHSGRNGIPRGGTEPVYWRDVYRPRQEKPATIEHEVANYIRERL